MTTKRKLEMDTTANEEAPPAKSIKQSREQPLTASDSENLAHQNISTFIMSIKNAIKEGFLNSFKVVGDNQIPMDIVDEILTYTQHSKMSIIWHAMCYKLGPLCALMKPGGNIKQIKSMEQIIGDKIGETSYELPSDIRISYMLCNSIRFNTMVLSKFWMTFLPECHLLPIDSWKSIEDDEEYNEWDPDDFDWENIGDFFENKEFLWIIGDCKYTDGYSQCALWNIKSGKICVCFAGDQGEQPMIFDSFKQWLIASCYHKYDELNTGDDLHPDCMKREEINSFKNIKWDKIDLTNMDMISTRYKSLTKDDMSLNIDDLHYQDEGCDESCRCNGNQTIQILQEMIC